MLSGNKKEGKGKGRKEKDTVELVGRRVLGGVVLPWLKRATAVFDQVAPLLRGFGLASLA